MCIRDSSRILIGDDEHGWSDRGIFNFEGGCYAKTIDLSAEAEPEIFATTSRFSTVIENMVYDPQTRSMLQSKESPYPSKNNKRNQDMVSNADGSIDLYFGPKPPAGQEANWVKTVPGKGWFGIFRLYGPEQAWFDRTWKLGPIDKL